MVKLFSCLLLAIILSGCNGRSVTYLNYAQAKHNLEWGSLSSGLRGSTQKVDPKTSITGLPYELLVIFSVPKKARVKTLAGCTVIMRNITLSAYDDPTNKRIIPNQRIVFKDQPVSYFNANFLARGLSLDYVDHRLSFDYYGTGKCAGELRKSRIEMTLKRAYEVHKQTFWDSLISV